MLLAKVGIKTFLGVKAACARAAWETFLFCTAASLVVLGRSHDFLGVLWRFPMVTQLFLALVHGLTDLTLEDCRCALRVRRCALLRLLGVFGLWLLLGRWARTILVLDLVTASRLLLLTRLALSLLLTLLIVTLQIR